MVFGIYRHHKGNYYLVLTKSANNAEVLNDDELEDTYIYVSLYKTSRFKMFKVWYKRASEFEAPIVFKHMRGPITLTTKRYQKLSLWESVKFIAKGWYNGIFY